jgi:hypothetical protein
MRSVWGLNMGGVWQRCLLSCVQSGLLMRLRRCIAARAGAPHEQAVRAIRPTGGSAGACGDQTRPVARKPPTSACVQVRDHAASAVVSLPLVSPRALHPAWAELGPMWACGKRSARLHRVDRSVWLARDHPDGRCGSIRQVSGGARRSARRSPGSCYAMAFARSAQGQSQEETEAAGRKGAYTPRPSCRLSAAHTMAVRIASPHLILGERRGVPILCRRG